MLATWVLFRGGYDLGRFYALEEFYVNDLNGYYAALVTHPNANYYFGRHEADITPWLAYFLKGMAIVFEQVATRVRSEISDSQISSTHLEYLRSLDYRARRVLSLFHTQEFIQSSEVASLLGLSIRQARTNLAKWVDQGWIEVVDPSKKGRKYRLIEKYKILLK